MFQAKFEEKLQRFKEIESKLAEPDIYKDRKRYTELMQEHSHLKELVDIFQEWDEKKKELENAQLMMQEEQDEEVQELVAEEQKQLEEQIESLNSKIRTLLIPKDPLDQKNIIMEIRAGTGGDEAALFAADLYRMYSRYAEKSGWKIEILSSHEIGIGGFKEIVYSISGKNVYENLRYESGVHRVQRIPATESGGRIHTSAVTVAVLPEAEPADVEISNEEIKVDVYRSSGPGGQSVNTTDSAVRITHIPTGLVVTCQDEKSQHKNKAKALRVLRARLLEQEETKKQQERSLARRSQIGSGDRSERIRTYNFPQNRLSDHRINLTLYKLDIILQGEMDEVIEELKMKSKEELLQTNPS